MMSEQLRDLPRYVARQCRLYGSDTASEVFDRGRNVRFCLVDPIGTGGDGDAALARAEEIAAAFNGRESIPPLNLPCDVRLPPATTIKAGCSLDTLLIALSLEGRPRQFDTPFQRFAQPCSLHEYIDPGCLVCGWREPVIAIEDDAPRPRA